MNKYTAYKMHIEEENPGFAERQITRLEDEIQSLRLAQVPDDSAEMLCAKIDRLEWIYILNEVTQLKLDLK